MVVHTVASNLKLEDIIAFNSIQFKYTVKRKQN